MPLSQKDIDAVLEAHQNNQILQDQATLNKQDFQSDDLEPVDLTSKEKKQRENLQQLEVIFDRFIRNFRISLSTTIRKVVHLDLKEKLFIRFGEVLNRLPVPSCINVIKYQGLRGSGLIIIDTRLVYALIEAMFGGLQPGTTWRPEGKEFTALEISLVKKVINLMLSDFEQSWENIWQIEPSYVRTEMNPQFVGIAPPTDIVLLASLNCDVEGVSGDIKFIIPYSLLEPIKDVLTLSFREYADEKEKNRWFHFIQQIVLESELQLAVILGNTEVTLQQILSDWKPGYVIQLNSTLDEVALTYENQRIATGLLGEYSGNYAFQASKIEINIEDKNPAQISQAQEVA